MILSFCLRNPPEGSEQIGGGYLFIAKSQNFGDSSFKKKNRARKQFDAENCFGYYRKGFFLSHLAGGV